VRGLLGRWLQRNKPDFGWVADVVEIANERLADRQAAVGPSYFMKATLTEEWVELIWEHSVIPYLAEQFLGQEEELKRFDLEVLRAAVSQGLGELLEDAI
jgi:5-methylcytosine-specific restriction protein B